MTIIRCDDSLLTPRPTTYDVDDDISKERIRRAKLYAYAEESGELRAYLYARCQRDPFFWLGSFGWMQDDKRLREHSTNRIPCLMWPYVVEIGKLFLGTEPAYRAEDGRLYSVAHRKSRDVGGTKLACQYSVWDCQFNTATYGYVSRKFKDVDNNKDQGKHSIFSFVRWVIRQQPKWLRPPAFQLDKRHRTDDSSGQLIFADTNSVLLADSTHRDTFRGSRCKRVMCDEVITYDDPLGMLETLQDVGIPWLCSTTRGGTAFEMICKSKAGFPVVDLHTLLEAKSKDETVDAQWVHYWTGFEQRPDRRPGTPKGDAWIRVEKAKRTEAAWAQEQLGDWEASQPGRIWAKWIKPHHVMSIEAEAKEVPMLGDRDFILVEAWDFGGGQALTCCVWLGYDIQTGVIYALDYEAWDGDTTADVVATDIAGRGWATALSPQGHRPHLRVGDMADHRSRSRVAGGRVMAPIKGWRDNLREYGISVTGQLLRVDPAISLVTNCLRDDRLYFTSRCRRRGHHTRLPSLLECCESYRRHGSGDPLEYEGTGSMPAPKPVKDVHSHLADALQHGVYAIEKHYTIPFTNRG